MRTSRPHKKSPSRFCRAFTLIELLVVIVIIAILMSLALRSLPGIFQRAKAGQAKADANAILAGVKGYFAEYNRYPEVAGGQGEGPYETKQELMDVLMAERSNPSVRDLNPRLISFFEPAVTTDKAKEGRGFNMRTRQFNDPYGNPFRVYMDMDYDDQVGVPQGYAGQTGSQYIRKTILVLSAGKDGKFETTEDNVATWLAK